MKIYKTFILGIIFALVAGSAVVVAHATTIAGTAGAGDECNVHAQDASHTCSVDLVCVPSNENSEGNGKCGSTVTPTPEISPEVTETPEASPTAELTPEVTPTPVDTTAGHGDSLSDGKSDGKSSCPSCTQAPATSPYDGSQVGWK